MKVQDDAPTDSTIINHERGYRFRPFLVIYTHSAVIYVARVHKEEGCTPENTIYFWYNAFNPGRGRVKVRPNDKRNWVWWHNKGCVVGDNVQHETTTPEKGMFFRGGG